jgi:hypothetical protein
MARCGSWHSGAHAHLHRSRAGVHAPFRCVKAGGCAWCQSGCPCALSGRQSKDVHGARACVHVPFRCVKAGGCAWCQSVCPCALPLRQSRGVQGARAGVHVPFRCFKVRVCMVPECASMRPFRASKQGCAWYQSGCPCALPLRQSRGVHGARAVVHAPIQGVKAGMCMVPERVSMRPFRASKQGCAWYQSGCPCAHSGRQSKGVHGARAGVHAPFQGVKAGMCTFPERLSMRPFAASKQGCAWCQSMYPCALSERQSRDVHVSRAVVHAPFQGVKARVCMAPDRVSMCPSAASKQGCARRQIVCPCALPLRQSRGVHGARAGVHAPFRCVKEWLWDLTLVALGVFQSGFRIRNSHAWRVPEWL